MKKAIKDILLVVVLFISVFLLCALLDIYDIPSQIGIPIQHINWDVAGLVCGNLVVVALFSITYQVLDKRSIQKEHNQRRVAIYMLRDTMTLCSTVIEWMKEPHTLESILKKIDTSKPVNEDAFFQKLLAIPFSDHESIVSFATTGILSEEEFSNYNTMRMYYRLTIVSLITFPDDEEAKNAAVQKFVSAMNTVIERLDRKEYHE